VTAAGPQQGECVACQTAGDCPDMMMCSLAVNACVQCESSSDCSGATPACNLNTLQCGCSHDTDCKPGDYCVPSMGTAGACVVGCHVTGGLSHCPVGDVCSVTTGGIGTCEVVPAVDAGPAMMPSAPVSSGCGCSPGGGSGMVWPAVAMLFAGLRRRRRVESREPSPTGMQ